MSIKQLKYTLYISSLTYLVLPYLVFFGGWIRQPYAIVLMVLLLTGVVAAVTILRNNNTSAEELNDTVTSRELVLFLLPVLLVALIAGVGGWGFQYGDWAKHNALLRDLIDYPWPVIYQINGERLLLTYYSAYQLPAAMVGKLFGWTAANHFLFVYTLFGLCLCALWVRLLTQVRWWWLFIIFLAFSGMDVIGQIMSTAFRSSSLSETIQILHNTAVNAQHLEWWSGWGFAQYSSMAALIFLVPNQASAGWLLTAMILSDARSGNLRTTVVLYLGLCSLWTPFVALGLIPLVLFLLIFEYRQRAKDFWILGRSGVLTTVAGLVTGLMVAVYLYSRFQPFVLPLDMSGIIYNEKITFTFKRSPNLFAIRYLLFVVLEFAVLHALLYGYMLANKREKFRSMMPLLIFSSAFLLLLPFLNWGWNNEPSMRSSIPTLFITMLITMIVLADAPVKPLSMWIKRSIIFVLLVGGLNAGFEVGRQVVQLAIRGELIDVPVKDEVVSIFEMQEKEYSKYHNFVGQYVGSPDSYYMKYLSRKE